MARTTLALLSTGKFVRAPYEWECGTLTLLAAEGHEEAESHRLSLLRICAGNVQRALYVVPSVTLYLDIQGDLAV